MSLIYFDIETGALPREELDALAPEFKPAANLKDPEKVRASIEEKRQAYYESAALSPVTGEVLVIGLDYGTTYQILGRDVFSEKGILEMFWDDVMRGDSMCGFNIAYFDLPFLIRRSMKHGVKVPQVFDRYRKLTTQFTDLMHVWQCGVWDDRISLDRLAKFLGVGQKNGDGKDFSKLWHSDRAKAIEYLKKDLELIKLCADKMLSPPQPEPQFESAMPS